MNRNSSAKSLVRLGLALALALAGLASGVESSAQDPNLLQVICLAEPPAAAEGESVTLRAWASTADGQPIGEPLSAKWDATEGALAEEAMTTQWDLTKVRFEHDERAKTLIATVTVAAEKRGPVRCRVEVFVAKTSQEPPEAIALDEQFVQLFPEANALDEQVAQLYLQGRYSDAMPLAQGALSIRQKALGPEHPDIATSLNNLALLYSTTGAYAEAEPLFQRALAIREKALGPEHPDTAMSLNNLAALYHATGAYAKAEPLYQRARAILEKTLGERTRGIVSAKHYLLSGQPEETGFGLYSYLLFSAEPEDEDEEQRARYLKTIEAYLSALPALGEMRNNERLSKLNVTYIPLKEMPKPATSNAEAAANVLAVYDYGRAKALLNRLDATYQRGPYLISVRDHPLREGAATYLREDLTGVVPEQARNWVKFFTYLAAQNRDWSEENFRRFGLNLRNLLAVAAVVTPDMAGVLGRVIQLRRLK